MRVDGEMPTPHEFLEITARVAEAIETLDREDPSLAVTFFEAVTAIGWEFFVRRAAELVVLEVGLGGRLDATNVCRPEVVAITNVSRDHTALLGETPAEIAFEKAGIIKPRVPCFSGVKDADAVAVVRRVCREREAPLIEIGDRFELREAPDSPGARSISMCFHDGERWGPFPVPLIGRHQAENAAMSLHLLKALADRGYAVGPDHARTAWTGLKVPARVEVVARRPTIIIDAAHNVASAEALVSTLREDFVAKRRILLFAGSREKDVAGMLERLAPAFDAAVFTAFQNNPRATPPEALLATWRTLCDRPAHAFERASEGLEFARRLAAADDLLCITGSFFLAAELRPLLA
jgi:dihydrofolate synthase/folylpolyglutamate synthase